MRERSADGKERSIVEKNDKEQAVALNVNIRGTEQTRQPTLANDSTVGLAQDWRRSMA
ncbi:MAG TPA: hypothetical protein VFV92_14970 [Candidatus Bathyarchaeia archaeon]|nr:hypothetical protein [Candidatus Bathyarchaeia archaeon]